MTYVPEQDHSMDITRLRRISGLHVAILLLTALVLVGLAMVVGRLLEDGLRGEALAGSERSAMLFAQLALEPDEFEDGQLTEEAKDDLKGALQDSTTVLEARVWTREGNRGFPELAYTSDTASLGRQTADADDVVEAFEGQTFSEVTSFRRERTGSGAGAQLVEVTVPIALAADRAPLSALTLYLDYEPVRRDIAARRRQLQVILVVAALLLFAALFPTLRRASRALEEGRLRRHSRVQRELGDAMERGELLLHYQPKLDLATRSVTGVEALLRWQSPARGLVPPLAFLPQAEQTPIIGPLTVHVVELALADWLAWRREGIDLELAINLSAANLRDVELPRRLGEVLDRHGAEREAVQRITLEITEGAMAGAADESLRTLEALRGMGFQLSLDDFGAGHSSFERLEELPLDELKLDRGFVARFAQNQDARIICAMVGLGHDLGLRVVAEGIESEEMADELSEAGCDEAQGYHFCRPLPAAELPGWVHSLGTASADRPLEHSAARAGAGADAVSQSSSRDSSRSSSRSTRRRTWSEIAPSLRSRTSESR